MDTHHATITGRQGIDKGDFVILGHVKNDGPAKNSSENAAHHHEATLTHKFFKEIASHMLNMDEIHVTGTGQIQEQFIKFLAETPQYKNVESSESTSNKMGDDQFTDFIMKHYDKHH